MQRLMTWLLMVLLTFPGCLCSAWCYGASHHDHAESHVDTSVPHLCDSHRHHHCCSHEGDAVSEAILHEIQSNLLERPLERFASVLEQSSLDLTARFSIPHALPSEVPKPSCRKTLVLLQRFLI
ncbi:MAG: hypothetical protein O2964_09900 [Verrucomicrobia bacterium]|nr:hypothetical protein [Verrucomicrobiota bacterium]